MYYVADEPHTGGLPNRSSDPRARRAREEHRSDRPDRDRRVPPGRRDRVRELDGRDDPVDLPVLARNGCVLSKIDAAPARPAARGSSILGGAESFGDDYYRVAPPGELQAVIDPWKAGGARGLPPTPGTAAATRRRSPTIESCGTRGVARTAARALTRVLARCGEFVGATSAACRRSSRRLAHPQQLLRRARRPLRLSLPGGQLLRALFQRARSRSRGLLLPALREFVGLPGLRWGGPDPGQGVEAGTCTSVVSRRP